MKVAIATPPLRAVARVRALMVRTLNGGKPIKAAGRIFCLMFAAALLSGCLRPAALSEPDRLYPVSQELEPVRIAYDDKALWATYLASGDRAGFRNEIISARMYAVDVNYTEYEVRLSREGAEFDLATALANNGLTTASTLVADPASKSILSGAASFVGFGNTAVSDKLLLKQTIQNIESGMRQARNEQAAVILANMKCDARSYPLGMALSDVEIYYRSGTFASGLIKVSENIANATADAKALKESNAPGRPTDALARLDANAMSASTKRGSGSINCPTPSSGGGGGGQSFQSGTGASSGGGKQSQQQNGNRAVANNDNVSPPPNALTDQERALTVATVKQFQQALCVSPAGGDFGTSDSATRQALQEFKATEYVKLVSDEEGVISDLNDRQALAQAVKLSPPCLTAGGPANAFEVGAFTKFGGIANLRVKFSTALAKAAKSDPSADLKNLQAAFAKPASTASAAAQDIRGAIKFLRAQFKMNQAEGQTPTIDDKFWKAFINYVAI